MRRVSLLMGVALALLGATGWWLYQARSPGRVKLTATVVPQEHGIRMEKFALRDNQHQQTRWEVLADAAEVDPRANSTMLERVYLTLFSAKHGTVQVTAQRGVIHNESKDMQVCGDVQLVMGEEFTLRTECLQWSAQEQMLASDTPVTVEMGSFSVAGQGFRGWAAEERFEVNEQVVAHWVEP